MSVTALRTPETEEPAVSSPAQSNWDDYSPLVDVFTDAPTESAQIRVEPRNRHFRLSLPFMVGSLVFSQLLGLVYLYSLDLKYTRQAAKLDEQIRQTRLQISLTQSKMAASKSTPFLKQWSTQLGYREAQMADMDDVTSNARFVPPRPKTEVAP